MRTESAPNNTQCRLSAKEEVEDPDARRVFPVLFFVPGC